VTFVLRFKPELAPGRWRNLNACIALLTPVLTLGGCVGPTLLSSQRPITVESLEGNYLRLALCTYERLNRKDGRLRITNLSDQDGVKIDFDPGQRHCPIYQITSERLQRRRASAAEAVKELALEKRQRFASVVRWTRS
jgi:hypothetical protein